MHCPLLVPLHLYTFSIEQPNASYAPQGHVEAACGENGKDSHNMPTSQPQQPFTQSRSNRLLHLIRNARKEELSSIGLNSSSLLN